MNPEYKEYLLGQNIYTQSQMFGLTPQQAEGMLALQNGLNMEKESR
jgi:hypothetical protein